MKSSPPRGTSRRRKEPRAWLRRFNIAWPALIVLALLASMAIGPKVSLADGDADTKAHQHQTALRQYQSQYLDPQANKGTDRPGHAVHGFGDVASPVTIAQNNPINRALIGKTIINGKLPQSKGGSSTYLPELPRNFFPIHVQNMTKGVLLAAGSGNSEYLHDLGILQTKYCDFNLQNCKNVATKPGDDVFCGDMVEVVDGSIYMVGGTQQWGSKGWIGSRYIRKFDENVRPLRWQSMGNTIDGHWYPTVKLRIDGDFLVVSGFGSDGKNVKRSERYRIKSRASVYTAGSRTFSQYPHLVRTKVPGRFAYLGVGTGGTKAAVPPGFWWPDTNKFVPFKGGISYPDQRNSGTTCAADSIEKQRFYAMGGFGRGKATNSIVSIDLNAKDPRFKAYGTLPGGLMYAGCAALPNGGNVILGGGSLNTIANASTKVTLIPKYGARPVRLNDIPKGEYYVYHNNVIIGKGSRCAGGILLIGSNPNPQGAKRNVHIVCVRLPMQVGKTPPTPKGKTVISKNAKKQKFTVSKSTKYISVCVKNSVTHAKDNGNFCRLLKVKKHKYVDMRGVRGLIIESKVDLYAVTKKGGAYSKTPLSVTLR